MAVDANAGRIAELRELLAGHHDDLESRVELAQLLMGRLEHPDAEPRDILTEVIELLRPVGELADEEDAEGRAAALRCLGNAYALRCWVTVDDANQSETDGRAAEVEPARRDRDAAIEAMRGALAAAVGDLATGIAGDLGELLRSRYLDQSDEDDLASAVQLLTRAATAAEPDLADLAELGNSLADRYDLHGDDSDRDGAITWLQKVYDVLVLPDPDSAFDHLRLAGLLIGRGEARRDATDVTAGIGYAQRSVAGLSEDLCAYPLYVLGVGHFVRAELVPAWDDFPIAAGHLRESRLTLPDDDPLHKDLTARLGVTLGAWLQSDLSSATKEADAAPLRVRADEAVRLLTAARRDLPADDGFMARVQAQLGITRGLRFIGLGGDHEDHEGALTELAAVLERPEFDGSAADVCHLFMAFLLFIGPVPETLRRVNVHARVDARLLGRIMAASPRLPSPEVARSVLGHLGRMSASASADSQFGDIVLSLRVFAMLALGPGNLADDDIASTIADIEEAIPAASENDPEAAGELRVLLGLLEGLQRAREGDSADMRPMAASFAAAAEQLGDDHPMGVVLRGVLGGAFGGPLGGRWPTHDERAAAIETLEAFLDEMPDDHPERADTLIRQGTLLVRQSVSIHRTETQLTKLRRQLHAAIERQPANPANDAVNHCLLGLVDGMDGFNDSDPVRFGDAVQRVKKAEALAPSDPRIQRLVRMCLLMLFSRRFADSGELEYLDAANYYARQALLTADGDETADNLLTAQYFLAIAPVMREHHRLDRRRVDEVIANVEAIVAQAPEAHEMRTNIVNELSSLRMLRNIVGPGGVDMSAAIHDPNSFAKAVDEVVAVARATPRENAFYAANMTAAGSAQMLLGAVRRDRRLVTEGIATLTEAYTAVDFLPGYRAQIQGALGLALRTRYELTRDRADLSNSIDRLEEARRLADQDPRGGPFATILYQLALGYHERGDENLADRHWAVETGRAALRERTGAVMLQSTMDRALDSALAAAGEAVDIARWCLVTGQREAAVEALERGRCMVLHAATADADVPVLLREAGHEALAAEWETALREVETADPAPWDTLSGMEASFRTVSGEAELPRPLSEDRLPSDLRYRAMRALAGTGVERPLAPPDLTEIARALRTAGAAAMAYLLPRDEGGGGLALIVDALGEVGEIPLPDLVADPQSPVARFAEAQRDRQHAAGLEDGDPVRQKVRVQWQDALVDLCDWAWGAVMERVLNEVDAGQGSRARLVLIPVGDLGLVPWHAARRTIAAGGHRYACQDAIITYAASARQFVDACRHRPRPWNSAAALVRVRQRGLYAEDLYFASKEVTEVHRRHYPRGVILGGTERRRSSGHETPSRATAENVLGLLPRPGAAGASMLHLGCHAEPSALPLDGRLRLESGGPDQDDGALRMRDVLRQARHRRSDTPGGLVLLAACGSDFTVRHHDEALTLATAFLAAGTVGVIGTRWPVDDRATYVFMTMFHHYLNSGYDNPALALRAVQTWMLNPGRPYPAYLPATTVELIREIDRKIDLTRASTWAAFTYQGQ